MKQSLHVYDAPGLEENVQDTKNQPNLSTKYPARERVKVLSSMFASYHVLIHGPTSAATERIRLKPQKINNQEVPLLVP